MDKAISKKTPQEIIVSIIDKMNVTVATFAKGMNQPYTKIFDLYRGKTRTFTESVIRSLVEHYNINETYLLTGEGEMFQKDTFDISATTDDLTNSFLRVTSALTTKNAQLTDNINSLNEEVARLKKILDENGISY